MPLGNLIPVYVKRFGTWYHLHDGDLYKTHDVGTGGHKRITQIWRKKSGSGVWELETDLGVPTENVSAIYTLQPSGISQNRAGRLSWTVITDSTTTNYNTNVEILWYNNNVSGIWRSDLVNQNTAAKIGPLGQTGDLMHCSYRYRNIYTNSAGPQLTTTDVTASTGLTRD